MKFQFKIQNSFEQRAKQSFQLIEKHEQRMPLIVELSMDIIKIQKKGIPNNLQRIKKMMVCGSMTIQTLFNLLKTQYSPYISNREALFIFYGGNKLLSGQMSSTIIDIYQKYKDDDGWLYLQIQIQENSG